MPMRLKSELYKKEQEEIIEKIISILDFDNDCVINLCDFDNDLNKQNKIMELIPEIRKWFSFNGIKAVGEPIKIKRPWLSIIKHLLKTKYLTQTSEMRIIKDDKTIRTMKYNFIQQSLNS